MGIPATLTVAAATTAAVVVVALTWSHRPLAVVAFVAFTFMLGLLTDIDLAERRLPNVITGPLALATLAGVTIAGLAGPGLGRAVMATVVGLVFSAALLGLSFIGHLGMGDVKLAFPIGVVAGWLGLAAVQATVLATAVTGGLVAAALLVAGWGRDRTLPYGPFLAFGSVAGIVVGAGGW